MASRPDPESWVVRSVPKRGDLAGARRELPVERREAIGALDSAEVCATLPERWERGGGREECERDIFDQEPARRGVLKRGKWDLSEDSVRHHDQARHAAQQPACAKWRDECAVQSPRRREARTPVRTWCSPEITKETHPFDECGSAGPQALDVLNPHAGSVDGEDEQTLAREQVLDEKLAGR